MTADDARDMAQMRRIISRGNGRNLYAPQTASTSVPMGTVCECVVDPTTGRQYCVCSSAVTSDMEFGQNKSEYIIHPATRMTSPCERTARKRRQMMIAKSHA